MRFSLVRCPVATITVCLAALGLTAGYLSDIGQGSYETLTKWGWVSADDLWSHQYLWGLVTNTFIHSDWIVFTWDMFWVAVLGTVFERNLGLKLWIPFYI